MARYYRNSQGLYETSRTINGKRVRFRGKTCADVDAKIAAYSERKPQTRTVEVIAEEWYETKEHGLRDASRRTYRTALNIIVPRLGEIPVSELTPLAVKRFVNEIESSGYSASTTQAVLGRLKGLLSYAVVAGDIDVNPATEVYKSRNLPRTRRSALTEEQERKVEAYRGEDYLLGLLLLYTGLRRGEALALTWQDIDREAGVIHVTKKVNYAVNPPRVDNFLKSDNGRRDVPIIPGLAAALPDKKIGLVFADKHGRHLSGYALGERWTRYCRAAGIEGVTPHQFRHSYATICYEAGIDAMAAAALMGDTPEVVSKVYTELRKSHHEDSADRVSAYLEMRRADREKAVLSNI